MVCNSPKTNDFYELMEKILIIFYNNDQDVYTNIYARCKDFFFFLATPHDIFKVIKYKLFMKRCVSPPNI